MGKKQQVLAVWRCDLCWRMKIRDVSPALAGSFQKSWSSRNRIHHPHPQLYHFHGCALNNEFILVVCDIASQTFLYFKFQVISEDFKSVSRQSFQVRVRVQRAACHVRQIFTQNWLMFHLLMFQPKVGILDRSAKSEWVIPTFHGKP
jgi:hypothetical protein